MCASTNKKNNTQPLDVFYAIIPKILPREVVNCKRASNTKFTIIIEARKHTHTHFNFQMYCC